MRYGPALKPWGDIPQPSLRINDVMAENFRRPPWCFLNLFRLLFAFSLLFFFFFFGQVQIFFFRLLRKHLKSLIRNLAVFCLVCFALISLDFITPRSFVERLGSRDLQSDGDSCYGIFIQCGSGIIPVITSKRSGEEGWLVGGGRERKKERERY